MPCDKSRKKKNDSKIKSIHSSSQKNNTKLGTISPNCVKKDNFIDSKDKGKSKTKKCYHFF